LATVPRLTVEIIFDYYWRIIGSSKTEELRYPILVCKVKETQWPLHVTVKDLHNFKLVLLERLLEDVFLPQVVLFSILRQP